MVQEEFFQRVCRFAQERGKPVLEAFAFAPAAIFVCQEGGNCGLYFDQRYLTLACGIVSENKHKDYSL